MIRDESANLISTSQRMLLNPGVGISGIWIPGTEKILEIGNRWVPDTKLRVPIGTAYRPDKKFWVPRGTGYEPENKFWVLAKISTMPTPKS